MVDAQLTHGWARYTAPRSSAPRRACKKGCAPTSRCRQIRAGTGSSCRPSSSWLGEGPLAVADVGGRLAPAPRAATRRPHHRRPRRADISPSSRAAFSRADMATLVQFNVSAVSVSHRSRLRSKSARCPAALASRHCFSTSSFASSACSCLICAFQPAMSACWPPGERVDSGVYWISARSTTTRIFPSLPGLRGSRRRRASDLAASGLAPSRSPSSE